jgi:tripartite-type tricarboxylate transporter receptor subunit TctC
LVVGYPAGGSPDSQTRIMAQWLSERFGQSFVVENRPGAGGNIGTSAVVRAPPDGYTLLVAAPTDAWNASLYRNLNFNFVRDIAPVAGLNRSTMILVVHPSFPATTVAEFIAYAKANPGKINMASVGVGGSVHMACELFKVMAGVDLVLVHYRGGAAFWIPALLAGEVQGAFSTLPPVMDLVRTGKLRALATTAQRRWETLPELPTVGDTVPGYEVNGWNGFGAPRNTPAAIIEKLNQEINAGLADLKIKARLADLGLAVFPASPAEFGKLIADDTEKWAKVVRAANIKPG